MCIYLYKKTPLDLLYMLIIKIFSYGLPQGFASGEAGLDVFNLKNFSANYIKISKHLFTVTKKFSFFRTQLPADFKQTLQGIGEEFFSPLEAHSQSSATKFLSSVLLNLFR